jgi:hypothetical protein
MSVWGFWLAFKALKPIFKGITLTIDGVEATPEKGIGRKQVVALQKQVSLHV